MAACSTTTFCKYLTRLLNVGQLLREKAIGTTRGHAKGETLATSGPYRRPLFKSGLKFWAELSVGRACRYRPVVATETWPRVCCTGGWAHPGRGCGWYEHGA